jgi:deoxycytidine triphosphate deaminase
MKIGQMIFHLMAERPVASYAQTGRYNGDLAVMASKG